MEETARSGTPADEIADIDEQIRALEEEERAIKYPTATDNGKSRVIKGFKPIKAITAAELDELNIQPIEWLVK